jgi:hypothetical protein
VNYAQAVKQQVAIKPAATLVLEPTDFADEWAGRPKSGVAVGIRRLSAEQEQGALEQTRRDLLDRPEDAPPLAQDEAIEQFNERLIVHLVGRALCDPNDARKPLDLFSAPDVEIPRALRRHTITRLWDTLEREVVGSSPVYREASDEEIAELGNICAVGPDWTLTCPPSRETRIRRFAAFLLDEIDQVV